MNKVANDPRNLPRSCSARYERKPEHKSYARGDTETNRAGSVLGSARHFSGILEYIRAK